jgi:hypothetical protein
MSEGYREHSTFEYDSEVGDPDTQIVEPEVIGLSRDAILEEMARFENFNVNLNFTEREWNSFSPTLKDYIKAKRFLSMRPDLDALEVGIPNPTKEAMLNPGGVTMRKVRTSAKAEQNTANDREEDVDESRDGGISESLRRTASNLMKSTEKTDEVKKEDVDGDKEEALCLIHRIM